MNEMDQFDFDLPKDRIAQHPLPTRSDSRLMLVNRSTGEIEHSHVRDLPQWLRAGDSLVLNNSRVVPAKLVGFRSQTRGRWQGLFVRADSESGVWEVLTKTRGTLKPDEMIVVQDRSGRDGMCLRCIARTDDGHLLVKPEPLDNHSAFSNDSFQLLDQFGRIPLPPYIRDGQMVDADLTDYQTVYAKTTGSIAAPTAGLHFTEPLLRAITSRGVTINSVTLHVGIGTFRPISVERLDDHRMHSEWGSIDSTTCDSLLQCRKSGGRVIAVGTTTVRVLESAARETAKTANANWLSPWTGETDLFIRPGHPFAAIDALMTNFHLPRSSLLVLVSALAGRELIMKAYAEAIREQYRFFSYGDAMLIY